MFTGIIQAVGKVESQEKLEGDVRLAIDIGELKTNLEVGDSIAVNGVCLTVADRTKTGFITDVSTETLSLTVLGKLQRGAAVNLETALTISTPLGGHVLNGHVDGIGEILIRGGRLENLEGDWEPKRFVMIRFDSVEQAKRWWDSDEYREARDLRQAIAETKMIVVEGYSPQD